jgi:hypothetical protein
MEIFYDASSAEYQAQYKAASENLDKKAVLEKELSRYESACTKNPTENLLKKIENLRTEIKLLNDSIFPPGLPIFIIPTRPTGIPPELEKLPSGARVQVELTRATKCSYEPTENAGDLVEKIKQTIKRQSNGFFFLDETVQILFDAKCVFNFEGTREDILKAQRKGDLPVHQVNNHLKEDPNNLHSYNGNWGFVHVDELDLWLESQGADYSFPNCETVQQDLQVTITINHIQFAHGIEFLAFGDIADLLAKAQCFGEVDETDLNGFIVRAKHREALLSAAQNGDLPVKDKSSKTRINLGSVQLSKNRIENSTCVTITDFQTYAKTLGVNVSVAELSNATQENEVAASEGEKPIQRFAAQETAILNAIKTQGYVALSLPKNEPGMGGVKKLIRDATASNGLFLSGSTVFNKAWERLRKSGEIADAI